MRMKTFLMLMMVLGALACVNLSFAQAAEQTKSTVEILKAELAALNLDNPAADVKKNLAAGDKRFVGIYGLGVDCPGVPKEACQSAYVADVIRPIKGTSDFIESDEHRDLIGKAANYAKKYNKELLKQLK